MQLKKVLMQLFLTFSVYKYEIVAAGDGKGELNSEHKGKKLKKQIQVLIN